jgi:hypothetical protein
MHLYLGMHGLFEGTRESKIKLYTATQNLYNRLMDFPSVQQAMVKFLRPASVTKSFSFANNENDTNYASNNMNGAKPDHSSLKKHSTLSSLHIPDIGSLMIRCQMCLEAWAAAAGADTVSGISNLKESERPVTSVPITQLYYCYKSLEVCHIFLDV